MTAPRCVGNDPDVKSEPSPTSGNPPPRVPILDIGAGDPEAPANSIPNILADLIETETWRNAATVLLGVLLIGLGYWAYHGIRDSHRAEARVASLEALLGTVVKGLDVWVGRARDRGGASRQATPTVVARAARLVSGQARRCRLPQDAARRR